MKKLTLILLLLLCAIIPAGCSDDGPASEEAMLQDVVMIEEMTSSSTTFAVALPGSREVAYLRSDKVITGEEIEPGICCIITYTTPEAPYVSADIDLTGCYGIPNLEAETTDPDEREVYSDTPVYLISAWSFCNRVILKMQLPYPVEGRKLKLIYEPSASEGATPVLRLIQDVKGTVDESYMKNFTVAFSLDPVNPDRDWENVEIMLNNSNLNKNKITLKL